MREIKFRAWNGEEMISWEKIQRVRIHTFFTAKTNNVTIEQYTGIKDRNGKEIYEGDICDVSTLKNKIVVFKDGKFGFDTKAGFYSLGNFIFRVKVIGNIHEEEL